MPFNNFLHAEYNISNPGCYRTDIVDISGRSISTVINNFSSAGLYNVSINNVESLPSGQYYIRTKPISNFYSNKIIFDVKAINKLR